jgi:hypothetical protein
LTSLSPALAAGIFRRVLGFDPARTRTRLGKPEP